MHDLVPETPIAGIKEEEKASLELIPPTPQSWLLTTSLKGDRQGVLHLAFNNFHQHKQADQAGRPWARGPNTGTTA